MLNALARALRLDDTERAHLIALARPARIPFATPDAGAPTEVRPSVQMLIDGLDQPAFVLGRRMDILATNRMARALLTDFDARPPRERNHARWIFLDPATRELYLDWPVVARETSRSCATTPASTPTIRNCASSSASSRWPAPSSARGGPSTT